MWQRKAPGCLVALLFIICIVTLGPIGILLALLLSPLVRSLFPPQRVSSRRATQEPRQGYSSYYREEPPLHSSRFQATLEPLMALFCAIMRADGRVMRSELDYVRRFLSQSFDPADVRYALLTLRDMLKNPPPLDYFLFQLRATLSPQGKVTILHICLGLAGADGVVSPLELQLLIQIAEGLGIPQLQYQNILSGFQKKEVDHYSVLGITRNATNEEVKKAYRMAAQQNHPDRFASEGEEKQREATEKFKRINEAYEAIKQQRGMR